MREYLGSAAFSKAVQCLDLHTGEMVCVKIIKNNKDFFDQSLDEGMLLDYLKQHDPHDTHHVVHIFDYFYHKEHLFIVCELLRDNLHARAWLSRLPSPRAHAGWLRAEIRGERHERPDRHVEAHRAVRVVGGGELAQLALQRRRFLFHRGSRRDACPAGTGTGPGSCCVKLPPRCSPPGW